MIIIIIFVIIIFIIIVIIFIIVITCARGLINLVIKYLTIYIDYFILTNDNSTDPTENSAFR